MIRIKIGRNQNIGNKLFQYMYCRALQGWIPNSTLHNVQLPEFKIICPDIELSGRTLSIKDGHNHSMSSIAYRLNQGIYRNLCFDGYVQRLEYYPNRDVCASLFPQITEVDKTYLGKNYLLINVRGNEVLGTAHPDYGPVPVSYFSQIADQTKLTPIVMGQLGDNDYSNEIRRRFAGCIFIPSSSPIEDFETIRNATNIVIGVSSFSWIAAWLSRTAEQIHMPVSGFYHPSQRPDIDLLPIRDDRYRFYQFPVEKWKASPEQAAKLLGKDVFAQMTVGQLVELIK